MSTKERAPMKMTAGASVRLVFWVVAPLLGFLQAWSNRMIMLNDTISYLDMGDYIAKGQWSMAVNGLWNPLYSGLLGLSLNVFEPSIYWEYPFVHILAFFIFVLAMGCYDFLLHQLVLLRRQTRSPDELDVPTWIWLTIGYMLFLWTSLGLITVAETRPDMLVAALFYLAVGLLTRIWRRNAGWPTYVGMGLALGLGYLTKSIMFPISLFCLAIMFWTDFGSRRAALRGAAATAAFLCLSLPLFVALSAEKGRITFSEAGTYNALVHIDHVPYNHWQGNGENLGRLLHPTREIVDRPATYEFAKPIGGTYPVWYDPSFWYEGAKPDYPLQDVAKLLASNLIFYATHLLLAFNGSLVAGLFFLFFTSGRQWSILRDVAQYWFLLIPSLATLGSYALVHVEYRYVGPFAAVALLCLFFGVHARPVQEARYAFAAVALLLVLMFISPIGPATIPKNLGTVRELLRPFGAEPNPNADVAAGLTSMGLHPGDSIASVERSNCAILLPDRCEAAVLWARLGRFRIVGEVNSWAYETDPNTPNYWAADVAQQEKVIRALAATGARVVVSRQEPRGSGAADWLRIGTTNWYVRWLVPQAAAIHAG